MLTANWGPGPFHGTEYTTRPLLNSRPAFTSEDSRARGFYFGTMIGRQRFSLGGRMF